MSPSIEIDTEVWEELKAQAEPFVDTPNSVLRRALGLDAAPSGEAVSRVSEPIVSEPAPQASRRGRAASARSRGAKRAKRARVPMGSLLPESAYEVPIMKALADRDGRAPAREVVAAVGKMVRDQLTQLDRQELEGGGQRWENRVQFTRLRLKKQGILKSDSRRGVWELAEAGFTRLAELNGAGS